MYFRQILHRIFNSFRLPKVAKDWLGMHGFRDLESGWLSSTVIWLIVQHWNLVDCPAPESGWLSSTGIRLIFQHRNPVDCPAPESGWLSSTGIRLIFQHRNPVDCPAPESGYLSSTGIWSSSTTQSIKVYQMIFVTQLHLSSAICSCFILSVHKILKTARFPLQNICFLD